MFTETETDTEMKKPQKYIHIRHYCLSSEMFEATKGVTSRKQKDRQYNGIIKSRTQKERQCNGQRYKENNDLQNTAPNIKDRATRTTLKLGMNSGARQG